MNREDIAEELADEDQGELELGKSSLQNVDPDEFFSQSAFRVVYQTNNFLLPQLRDLIKKGEILNIRPEYQRRLRWSTPQKSKLIESLLLNIPVPSVFFYESEEARYEVMDGQQRLNAIKEYFEGDFALSTLNVLKPLNGMRYSKLPPKVKRALDRATLSAIVLLAESETNKSQKSLNISIDIRRFIFDRLNTGGRKLNPQELRNAIYPGEFNKSVVRMARRREFTDVFGIPAYTEAEPNEYYENPARQRNALYAAMGDCQLVLRFFALRDRKNIRGAMKSMLDRSMESRMTCSKAEAEEASQKFATRFDVAVEVFSPFPFRMPADDRGFRRLSAGLYDAAIIAVDRLWRHRSTLVSAKSQIRKALAAQLQDESKIPILTGKTSTATSVKERLDLMEKICRDCAGI